MKNKSFNEKVTDNRYIRYTFRCKQKEKNQRVKIRVKQLNYYGS